MLYAGIDPGLHGGFAAIDDAGEPVIVLPIPTVKSDTGRGQYDLPGCRALFIAHPRVEMFVTVERLGPLPAIFKHKGEKEAGATGISGGIANFNRGLAH